METIEKWKQRGNEYFKMNQQLKAINCWEEALASVKALEYEEAQKAQIDKQYQA